MGWNRLWLAYSFLKNAFGTFPYFPRFLHFSTSATETSPPQNSLLADYLVDSYGFSREEALNLSSSRTRVDCLRNPNSVLKFLKESGLSDSQIRKLITKNPALLSAKVEKTLKPKFEALWDLGFSRCEFADFIASNPNGILARSVTKQLLPSIKFLRTLLPTDELVIKAIKRSSAWILVSREQKYMVPNINFLQKCGVSDQNITKFIWIEPRFMMQNTNRLKELVEKVEEWGVTRNSGMLIYGARALGSMSKSTLETKFEIFRRFGLSETDIHSAFRRCPVCLTISESKIQRVMDFLLNTVGCDRSYIVSHPKIITNSLENRLIPRYCVMQTLKSRELIGKIPELTSILQMTEKKFLDAYVIRHLEEVPHLQQLYMNSRALDDVRALHAKTLSHHRLFWRVRIEMQIPSEEINIKQVLPKGFEKDPKSV